jgi:DNA-directed RNA polymerase specialized sigma24 family protein
MPAPEANWIDALFERQFEEFRGRIQKRIRNRIRARNMRLHDFEQIENDVLFDLYRALNGREEKPSDNEILSILYAIADYRTLDSIRALHRRKRRSCHLNAGLGMVAEIEDPCPSPAHAAEVQDLFRCVLNIIRPRALQIVQLWIDGETTKSISMSIGLGIRSVERELREFRALVDAGFRFFYEIIKKPQSSFA